MTGLQLRSTLSKPSFFCIRTLLADLASVKFLLKSWVAENVRNRYGGAHNDTLYDGSCCSVLGEASVEKKVLATLFLMLVPPVFKTILPVV